MDAKWQRVMRLFNLTEQDVAAMRAAQEGKCPCCLRELKRDIIEHCHKTGHIRGLLCWFCNALLGKARDDIAVLERAIEYLRNPPADKALGGPRFGCKGRVANKASTRKALNRKKTNVHKS